MGKLQSLEKGTGGSKPELEKPTESTSPSILPPQPSRTHSSPGEERQVAQQSHSQCSAAGPGADTHTQEQYQLTHRQHEHIAAHWHEPLEVIRPYCLLTNGKRKAWGKRDNHQRSRSILGNSLV